MRNVVLGILPVVVVAGLTSCGGGLIPSSDAPGGSAGIAITIVWPERAQGRLIPQFTKSIRLDVEEGEGLSQALVATQLTPRPDQVGQVTVEFPGLTPYHVYTLEALAYPGQDGSGIPLGEASVPATTGGPGTYKTVYITLSSTVAGVDVTPSSPTLSVGATIDFASRPRDGSGRTVPAPDRNWEESSGGTLATIDDQGHFTALAPGTVTVTAWEEESGAVGHAEVTIVSSAAVATVQVTPASATVGVGGTIDFMAVAKDASGNQVGTLPVQWSESSAGALAAIAQNGHFTALAGGSVTVTATETTSGVTGQAQVTILASSTIAMVQLTPSSANVSVGDTIDFTAVAKDASGNVVPTAPFEWSESSGGALGAIAQNGHFTALGEGTVTVTARESASGVTGQAVVTITPSVTVATVQVTPSSAIVGVGGTIDFAAVAKDASGSVVPTLPFQWSESSGGTLATIAQNGHFVGLAQGTVTVTARDASSGVTGQAVVTVIASPTVATVQVTPSNASVSVGGAVDFTAVAKDASGNIVPVGPFQWSEWSGGTLATIDQNGHFSALAPGSVTVTARETESGVTGQATVNITAPTANPIIFVSDRDGNAEIYVMDSNGANQRRVTNSPGRDDEPSWSPDGDRVVFWSTRDGNSEIYVMNWDGTGERNLTNSTSLDETACWSPDGTKIAFFSGRDGNYEVYVMGVDGTGLANLTRNVGNDFDPAWSPDGTRIAFVSSRAGSPQVWIMNSDGTGQTQLTLGSGDDRKPSWSPDGTRIAFHSYRDGVHTEIYVMNSDGTNQVRLTNNPGFDAAPSWSPNGTKIAFFSERDGNREIYVMNADGTNQVRLTNNGAQDEYPSWGAF